MVAGPVDILVLGELVVRRGPDTLVLPPSRKTRALLAYLALTGRSHRREQLCEIFWDVADDPRGALRWSLSRLRALLDQRGAARVSTERDVVWLDPSGFRIDLIELRRALAGRPAADMPSDELERLAAAFRGEPLEGLDLPDFDAYQAWCVGQREEARSMHAAVLAALVDRLRDRPQLAVDHARRRVQLDPHDVGARAALIRVVEALGRREEARTHLESGRRLAAELGGRAASEAEEVWRALDAALAVPASARSVASVDAAGAPALARRRTADSPRPGKAPPLIGRDTELAGLDAALARAAAGFAAALVLGEAGAGKSRLLAAWSARVAAANPRARVIGGRAFEGEAGRPYAPWLDVLRRLAARLPVDMARPPSARDTSSIGPSGRPPLAGAPGAPRLDLLHGGSQEELFDGVVAALEWAAAAPLVIVLDDVHWLDPGSASLLLHVARAAASLPVAVVLAARAGELDDNAALARSLRGLRELGATSELEIPPLGRAATAALVRAVDADADADRIYVQSRGNPLFALELARAGEASAAAPPASVAAVIRDRVEALPADAATVLRWGAVLGRGFAVDELVALSGLDDEAVVRAIEHLERRALLARAEGDRHDFAHELVRRVVHDALSEPRRRLMHRRIAQSLARRFELGEADVAAVAHHAALAHDSALAAGTCLVAARRSLRVFAVADAHALARRGLRHVEALADPERTCRELELYEVMLAAWRPDDVVPVARQVEALAERALDLGSLEHARLGYHLLAWLRWEHGAWAEARRFMLQAQLVSRGASETEQIVSIAEVARCLVLLEKDLGQAQALALEAQARGRIARVEPPATWAALGMLHFRRGSFDDACVDLERAVSLARAARDHHEEFQCLEQLVMLELARGDLDAASARAAELVELGARFRDGSEAPLAGGLAALVGLARGEDADGALDAAAEALARADAKQRLAYLLSNAAWLDVERGAAERAVRRAGAALAAAIAVERTTEAALARAVLARVATAGGEDADRVAELLAAIATDLPRVAASVRALIAPLVAGAVAEDGEEDP
jgi:DNA-binding SARP family transcriptional activator